MPSLSEETHGAVKMLQPGATIGIIGGGQLYRMMALSAKYMGFRIGVLDPTPDCPTAQVADFQVVGEYDDKTAIHDLAEKSDVLTYEFENVDAESIDEVRHLVAAAGHRPAARYPGPHPREDLHQQARHRDRTLA